MALFNTQLLIQAAHLPATFKGTPDDLFVAMVERMKIVSPSGISFFVTGDTMPSSNQGPWLKGGTQWWVFDPELKTYVPLDVSESETKWFQVGATVPTTATPPVWLRTTANPTEAAPNFGTPVAWYLFDGTNWIDFTSLKDRSITQAKLYWLANFYAVTSGVNNYSVTFAPTPTALPFGYGDGVNGSFFCIIKFANTNTGSVSLNVNGLSPRPVKKNVSQDIVAGEILAGAVHLLAYDGENFQIQTPVAIPVSASPTVPGGIVASADGLIVQNDSGSPTTTVNITAQKMLLSTTNGAIFNTFNVNQNIDITIPGLGGLDTTTTPEAPSTWYYIWVVSNGTSVSAVFSTSNTSPELPSDYIYTALLGAIYNDAGSNLILIWQEGHKVWRIETQINTGGAITGLFSIGILVPVIAKSVKGNFSSNSIAATIQADANMVGGVFGSTSPEVTFFELPLINPQMVYLAVPGGAGANVSATGFTI